MKLRNLFVRWPWKHSRAVPKRLADVYVSAHVLAKVTEMAVANQSMDFEPELLRHARLLIEAIENARRVDIPARAKVLVLAKRGRNV
jgi:hypothetical protein